MTELDVRPQRARRIENRGKKKVFAHPKVGGAHANLAVARCPGPDTQVRQSQRPEKSRQQTVVEQKLPLLQLP